ncbi:MAG: N-acetyl-gamma-glutamyl-phosphate reductase [Oscillospiraceae bacterium]|nr:N-acetyl-gamma-glutamyl-phosphate reductase [Oscillospiraceae bacterium]
MKPKIFIDGKEGTTGLQIYDRLGARDDIELLLIDEDKRKDTDERRKLINAADIVFLCLPDAAAKEAVALVENDTTRIIDASTAHRTSDDWVYGLPELSLMQRKAVASSKRVANPGCHATGFITTTYPLVKMGVIPKNYPLTCFSLTGYSGGGKKMIAQYEADGRDASLSTPAVYGVNLSHKHIPEMQKVTGLEMAPVFCPIVDDYYKGMSTTIMLHSAMLGDTFTANDVRDILEDYYDGEKFVKVAPELGSGSLYSDMNIGTNELLITVSGNDERIIVTARFDNLGKGASGAAVQNMNIMLGLDEATGL